MNRKHIFLNTVIIVAVLLAPHFARAATIVSGDIATDTHWTLDGSPYIVSAPVTISTEAALAINPGVIVKFARGAGLNIKGQIQVQGTDQNPIVFTSYADDEHGIDIVN